MRLLLYSNLLQMPQRRVGSFGNKLYKLLTYLIIRIIRILMRKCSEAFYKGKAVIFDCIII